MPGDRLATIQRNFGTVKGRIADACRRAGRSPESVTLVAVTKMVSLEDINLLYELGQRELGESRPQSLWEKKPRLPSDIRWHLVGHLQSNKIRRTIPLVASIDSLDRWALAEELSNESERIGRELPVLIELNLTGEIAKHGFSDEELFSVYPKIMGLSHLQIRGLMCMARLDEDVAKCRPTFRALRNVRDRLRELFPAGPSLLVLSMGMSDDFEIAIEEGATQVRIGSALWEGLS